MLEKVIENWTSRLDYFRASRGSPMPEIIFKILASDGLTNTALFADDLAIWCSTPKRDQSKLNTILNLTLERLHLWCIENNMTVNLKKTT
ncbi:hypothetical protein TNCV_397401 [Trichonephila clavipes]|nr:hypothetical protein TNCV_397401 [Trichonephila clavipes]